MSLKVEPSSEQGSLSPGSREALTWIVTLGVLYNNLLRWYPFPAGRSANDLSSLSSNIAGIVVNVAVYCALLAVVLLGRSRTLLSCRSRALQAYAAYLMLQAPFRPDPINELARSIVMALMLVSADWLATVVMRSPAATVAFLRRFWVVLLGTILTGILIGLLVTDAVNWGNGLSPSFENQNRAEFFFFFVLPHFAFAFSLAIAVATFRRPGILFLLAATSVVLIAVLAGLTMTRTITFSLLLIALVFMYRYARKTLLLLATTGMIMVLASPKAALGVADRLRISTFLESDPSVDATTGRLFLILTNLHSFEDSPVFGQGAVEARRRVEASGSIARTEHGYSIHLASSGLFSLLLFVYVINGLVAALRIILTTTRPGGRQFDPFGIAIAALAIASFVTGFFWTFSSATNFYDWLSVFFVSGAQVLWRESRTRGSGATLAAGSTLTDTAPAMG